MTGCMSNSPYCTAMILRKLANWSWKNFVFKFDDENPFFELRKHEFLDGLNTVVLSRATALRFMLMDERIVCWPPARG